MYHDGANVRGQLLDRLLEVLEVPRDRDGHGRRRRATRQRHLLREALFNNTPRNVRGTLRKQGREVACYSEWG